MQRLKDWMSGSSSTPPSADPSHSAKDDLRHAGQDLVHAKDDLKAQAKYKAHGLAQGARDVAHDVRDEAQYAGRVIRDDADTAVYKARLQAARAKAELREDAHEVAEGVRSGLHSARDTVVGSAVLLEDKIESGFDRMGARVHHAAERARAAADRAKAEVRDDARAVENKARDVKNNIKEAVSTWNFANYDAPWYRDVGHDFDVTFNQPLLAGKRVAITTPNLLNCRTSEWSLSHVHESDGGAEQIASNLSWHDMFFNRRPLVRVQNSTGGVTTSEWEFNRPQKVAFDSYIALPMLSTAKPTLRTGFTVTDVLSGCVLGGYFKTSGSAWLAAYKTRLPYVTVAGAVSNDGKLSDRLVVSGGVASTVFTDSARDSAINVGLEVKSGKFSTSQQSFPNSIGSITGKIEYDEPRWNFDARVRARSYTSSQSQQQELKVSDAHVRGLYVWNQGQYPRTALGVTVGVMDGSSVAADSSAASSSGEEFHPYGDPDERRLSHLKRLIGKRGAALAVALDQPVVSGSICHAINPRNKLSLHVTSVRALAACFSYNVQPGVKIQTGVSTQLPSWNLADVAKAGGLGKPQLGLAVSIGAF